MTIRRRQTPYVSFRGERRGDYNLLVRNYRSTAAGGSRPNQVAQALLRRRRGTIC